MNDGACDARGRFWAGYTGRRPPRQEVAPSTGSTARAPAQVLDGLTIPNGVGWSPDCPTMYLVDSGRG